MEYTIISEGAAKIFYSEEWLKKLSRRVEVFYNPKMRINRDFTIASLKVYSRIYKKKLDILDAMAGSGIRSIRILLEVPEVVERLVINDINTNAVNLIKKNLELNGIQSENVVISNEDCRILMLKNKYDYIDIDPFGSPVGFVQLAVLSLRNKGMLGVTATDISALSGSRPKACYRKYSCIGVKTDFYLEFGLRVLAKYVIEEALKFDTAMIPIFGYYYMHHYRIFFIKSKKGKDVNFVIENIKHIYYCSSCHYKSVDEKICPLCKKQMKMLGPIYIGPLYDDLFMKELMQYKLPHKESFDVLIKISNGDFKYKDLWYYYDISQLAKSQRISNIPKIKKILEQFNAVRTHFSPLTIKSREYPILKDIIMT